MHDRQYLDALTKEQLLRLGEDFELEGQSAMSKHELIEAITREGEFSRLRCPRLNCPGRTEQRRRGGTSMTKDAIIAAINTS